MNKDVVLNIANLYLEGLTMRQIAKQLNLSMWQVQKNLKQELKNIDDNQYQKVINKINDKKRLINKDETIQKRVLKSYQLLIYHHKKVSEIASLLNVSYDIVYYDLKKRLPKLSTIVPDIITPEMIEKVNKQLQHNYLNNLNSKKVNHE